MPHGRWSGLWQVKAYDGPDYSTAAVAAADTAEAARQKAARHPLEAPPERVPGLLDARRQKTDKARCGAVASGSPGGSTPAKGDRRPVSRQSQHGQRRASAGQDGLEPESVDERLLSASQRSVQVWSLRKKDTHTSKGRPEMRPAYMLPLSAPRQPESDDDGRWSCKSMHSNFREEEQIAMADVEDSLHGLRTVIGAYDASCAVAEADLSTMVIRDIVERFDGIAMAKEGLINLKSRNRPVGFTEEAVHGYDNYGRIESCMIAMQSMTLELREDIYKWDEGEELQTEEAKVKEEMEAMRQFTVKTVDNVLRGEKITKNYQQAPEEEKDKKETAVQLAMHKILSMLKTLDTDLEKMHFQSWLHTMEDNEDFVQDLVDAVAKEADQVKRLLEVAPHEANEYMQSRLMLTASSFARFHDRLRKEAEKSEFLIQEMLTAQKEEEEEEKDSDQEDATSDLVEEEQSDCLSPAERGVAAGASSQENKHPPGLDVDVKIAKKKASRLEDDFEWKFQEVVDESGPVSTTSLPTKVRMRQACRRELHADLINGKNWAARKLEATIEKRMSVHSQVRNRKAREVYQTASDIPRERRAQQYERQETPKPQKAKTIIVVEDSPDGTLHPLADAWVRGVKSVVVSHGAASAVEVEQGKPNMEDHNFQSIRPKGPIAGKGGSLGTTFEERIVAGIRSAKALVDIISRLKLEKINLDSQARDLVQEFALWQMKQEWRQARQNYTEKSNDKDRPIPGQSVSDFRKYLPRGELDQEERHIAELIRRQEEMCTLLNSQTVKVSMADIWTGVEGKFLSQKAPLSSKKNIRTKNEERKKSISFKPAAMSVMLVNSMVSGVTNTLVESPKEEDEEKEENEEKDWMEEEPDDVFSDGSWPVFFDVSDAVLVLQEGSKIRTKKLTELYEHIEKVAARVKKRFGPLAWHFDATEQRCVFLQNPRLSLVPVMQRILEDMKNAGSLALGRARAHQLKELQVALNTVSSKLGAERREKKEILRLLLAANGSPETNTGGPISRKSMAQDKKALEMSLTQLTDESWGKDTATKMDEVTTDIIGFYGSYRAQVQARKAHMADPENRRAVMRSAGIDLHALHPELQEKLNLPLDRDLPDVQLEQQELQNDLKEPKPSAGKKAVSRVLRLLHAGTVPLKQDLKKESPARALSSELEAPAAMAPSQKTRTQAVGLGNYPELSDPATDAIVSDPNCQPGQPHARETAESIGQPTQQMLDALQEKADELEDKLESDRAITQKLEEEKLDNLSKIQDLDRLDTATKALLKARKDQKALQNQFEAMTQVLDEGRSIGVFVGDVETPSISGTRAPRPLKDFLAKACVLIKRNSSLLKNPQESRAATDERKGAEESTGSVLDDHSVLDHDLKSEDHNLKSESERQEDFLNEKFQKLAKSRTNLKKKVAEAQKVAENHEKCIKQQKAEILKLLEKISGSLSQKVMLHLENPQQRARRWQQEIKAFKGTIKGLATIRDYWADRFEGWYGELLKEFGEETARTVQNEASLAVPGHQESFGADLTKHLLQRFLEDAERKKKELQNDGQGETVSSQLGTGLATGGAEKASAPPAIQKLLERTTGLNSVLRLRATSTKPGSDQHAVGQGLPSLTGVAPLEINPRSVSVTGGCPEERSEGQKKPSPDGLGILGGLSGFSNMLLATKRRRDQLRKQSLKTPLREDSHAHPTPSTSLMSVLEDDDKAKIKESAAAEGSLSHLSGKSQVDQRLLWESNGWGQASAGQDSINDSNADNPEDPFGQLKGWKKFRMKRILVSARRDSVGEIGLTEDMLRLAEEAAAPDKEKASSSKKKKESGQTATGKKIEKTEKQEAEESPSQKFGLLFGAEDPRKAIAKADAEEKPWKPVIPPVVPSLQRQLQNALLKGRILHGEFGLYLLRTFRKRLLQRYSGPVEAFVETTHTTGRAQLDQVLMSKDEFRALASHLAFTMPQCRMMLKKLSTLLPGAPRAMPETSSAPANEAEVEGLSRDDFTRLIRITLPLRSFRELRWRLLRQYGGLTSAFKAAAAGGRRLGRGAFSKLLEQVGAFASEADRFFARILPHNEIPLEGMQVTQRAFLLSLQHAEGLTAARRLIRLLTRELPPAGGPDSMQELALTLIIRLVPEDKEELGADIVKKDLGSKALHFQVLRQVVKPLGLSRAAADALFRLPSGLPAACRRKGQKVTIEDVALAAVAGLGCEAHSLSSRLHLFRPEGRPLVSEGLQTEEDISKEKEAETAWQDKLFHYVPLAQAYGYGSIGIAKRLKKRLTSAAEAGLWAMLEGKDHNVQESLAAIISCNKDPLAIRTDERKKRVAKFEKNMKEKVMKKHTDKLQARLEARLEAQSSQEPGSSADAASHDDGLGTADKIEGGLNIGAEVEEGEGSESDDTSEAESKSNESEEHVLVEEEEEGVETEEQLKESAESLAIEKHQKESKEDNLEKADDLKASSTKSVDKVDELKGSSQDNLEKVDELKDSSKESAEKADDSGMEKLLKKNNRFVKQLSRFNREASKDKTEPVETEEEKQRKIEEEKARAEEEKKRITQEEQDKENAEVLERQRQEAVRRTARLERFDNDQLDRATRSLQAFRVSLLGKFKTQHKAYEKLNVSRGIPMPLTALAEKAMKLLAFNLNDAHEVVSFLETLSQGPDFDYDVLEMALRYATPVTSLLEMRKRLVQLNLTIEEGFRGMSIWTHKVMDVGTFERPMLISGVLSLDANHLFRMADVAQPGGRQDELTGSAFEFALSHSHVLAWLEVFQGRLLAKYPDPATAFQLAAKLLPQGIEEVIENAAALEVPLSPLGFPSQCMAGTFAFLHAHTRGKVTLASLLKLLRQAFPMTPAQLEGSRQNKLTGRPSDEDAPKEAANFAKKPLRKASKGKATNRQSAFLVGAEMPALGTRGFSSEDQESALLGVQMIRQRSWLFGGHEQAFAAMRKRCQGGSPGGSNSLTFQDGGGVSFQDWPQVMDMFNMTDAKQWTLVFGHIVQWQHVHWDATLKGGKDAALVTLSLFSLALADAASCHTLGLLKERLQAKHGGTIQKAWRALAGGDFVQDITLSQWQRGLLQMSVNSDDAGELFAQLRSVPLQDKPSGQSLTRSALFAAMQKPDAISRLIQLLTKLQHKNQKGVSASASSSFEGRSYGTAQLSQADFERQMAKLSLGTIQEAKLIYSYLDVNQDGQVHMDDLLNALTAFEGGYLPYREVKPAAFFPKDPEPESSDAAEESSGSRQTPSSKLKALIKSRLSPTLRLLRSTMTSPVDLRSASRAETIAEELAEDRPGLTDSALSMRPPSSLLSVAISPTDIKSCHAGGSSASGRSTALAAASTALPDDSDSDEERRQEAREVRRPWTSQEASSRTSPASMTKRPMGGVKQIQLQKRLRSAAGTTRPASSLGAVSSPTGIGRGSPSPVAASSPVVGSALPKAPMMQLGPTVNLAAALDGLPQQEVNRGLPGSSKPLQTPRLEAGSRKANTSPQGKLPALAGGLAGRPKASPR